MTVEIPYIWIPICALLCFLILLTALGAAKKTPLIRSFIVLILCYTLWTGGSLLMRLQIFPGYVFWYEVSLLSLFCVPLVLYKFIHDYVGAKGNKITFIWAVVTVVMLILTHLEVFLKRPVFVDLGNGHGIFQYDMQWPIIFPTVVFFILISSGGVLIYKAVKRRDVASSSVLLLVIGMLIMLVCNFMSVLPGNIFPFDTLSGILHAGIMFYALYKKRLFKLSLLVSKATLLIASLIMSSIILATTLKPLEASIARYIPQAADYSTIVIAIGFSVISLLIYRLILLVIDILFVKDERMQAQRMREFATSISKSLDIDEISALLIKLVCDTMPISNAYICLPDASKKAYVASTSRSPLDVRSISLSFKNPCIEWMHSHDECMLIKDFSRTAMYKSMWEEEKHMISFFNIGCFVPLVCDGTLAAVLVLTNKQKGAQYTYDDIAFLESAQAVASIAIKNANLYRKAYFESRIDNLTGLLNRKFFYERINEEFTACKSSSLALVILNIDDFKLYNELYGNREGDAALKNIACIIKSAVGDSGHAARYSGKEFAIILPGWDTYRAQKLANEIRKRIIDMNKSGGTEVLKVLTCSGGICVYPFAASNVTQLISNADMAVYNAKRSGKNTILIYSLEHTKRSESSSESQGRRGYSDYASTIYALTAAIDAKDHYTFNHSQAVARYATALGRAIGLNEDHVRIIYEAALLHDIGKIGIPEHILAKPSRLTNEEYVILQKHVENAVAIIRHLPSLDYVIPAAIGHHERWDGRGYPRGIAGEDIPIAARCLAVADTFDAMTSDRPYRKALPVDVAVAELERMAGTQFDPQLVPVFVDLIRSDKITLKA